jgi:hypothetical protein
MGALRTIGRALLVVAVLATLILFAAMFVVGTAVVASIILPIVGVIAAVGIVFCVIIFLPMAASKKTRFTAAIGFYVVSCVFGLELWIFGFLDTLEYFGALGVVLGFLLAGVGFVPIAMLAAALHGAWSDVLELVFLLAATYGARAFALYLAAKVEDDAKNLRFDAAGGPIIEHEP